MNWEIGIYIYTLLGFPRGSVGKNPPATAGDAEDVGLILGSEDRLEKRMATHSSILVWKIPWTKEPGGLQSMGWQGVRHRVTNAFAFFLSQFSSATQVFPTL